MAVPSPFTDFYQSTASGVSEMKRMKMLLAWILILSFVCVGCQMRPSAARTTEFIGTVRTIQNNGVYYETTEQAIAEGELFRTQFEGDTVAGNAEVVDGKYRITATKTDGEAWHIKLESNYPTVPGNDYRITYTFVSDVAGRVKFGDTQEFPIQVGSNEVTGVITAKNGTTYLDLQLGMLQPFVIDVEKIAVAEVADEATFTSIMPVGFSFDSDKAVYEQHDDGFTQSIERAEDGVTLTVSGAPANGDVWNSKLFVRTGAVPEAGKRYLVTAELAATQAMDFEICFNNGDIEKGYGALYGQHLSEEPATFTQTITIPKTGFAAQEVVLQLMLGKSTGNNRITVKNVNVEEINDTYTELLPADFAMDGSISLGTTTRQVPNGYTEVPLNGFTFVGSDTAFEGHDDGYVIEMNESADGVDMTIVSAPENDSDRGVWKAKLFVDTGVTPEEGKTYRVMFDLTADRNQAEYEVCFDGSEEKAFGALYGRSLSAGAADHVEYTFTPSGNQGALKLRFQLGKTDTKDGNTYHLRNFKLEVLGTEAVNALPDTFSYDTGTETQPGEFTEVPLTIRYYAAGGSVTEAHDGGYVAALESRGGKACYRILKAPDDRNVWNAKLFIRTGFTPEAGKKYKIGLNLTAEKGQDYEICYNGGAEKDYGAEYGLRLNAGENHADHTVIVDAEKGELIVCLQLGKTESTAGNTVTVGNITIAELTQTESFHSILTGFGYPYVTSEEVEHPVDVPEGYQNVSINLSAAEAHDPGYEQSLSGMTLTVSAVPEDQGVWKSKVFVDTQTNLEAGATYRISAKVSAAAAMGFEICYNNGAVEKGYEALYGQSVAADGTVNCVKEFTVPADKTDLNNLVLQFQFGNTPAPNTITVSNVKLEKWTEAHTETETETVETVHKGSFDLWAHEDYAASLSGGGKATVTIDNAPGGREVWKVKLFANTNTALVAGKTYRISATVTTTSSASYEVCYNNGGEEKGVKENGEGCAEYGQTGSKTIERIITPDADAALNLQFSIGNLNTDETFTVSNVKVEENGAGEEETEVYNTTPTFTASSDFSFWGADGYAAALTGNGSTATLCVGAVPEGQEVWKLKLFGETGAHLTAGTPYRISLSVNPSAAFSYEVCFNNGGEEKGVRGGDAGGAIYGLSGKQDLVYEVTPETDADLVIQVSAGNAPAGSTVSVSDIHLETPGEGGEAVRGPVNFWAHDGYAATLSNTSSSASIAITEVPESGREVWKLKLFVETGAALSAGKTYRITTDVQATNPLSYEICYNNGGEEKGVKGGSGEGAIYGLSASSAKQTVTYTVTPETDAMLVLQFSLGNADGANTITVSNVHVEELVPGAVVEDLSDHVRFDSEGYIQDAADAGYITEMEQNANSVVYRILQAPEVRNPWNVKLHVKTGFTPKKNTGYRVSFDIESEKAQDVLEVFYDGDSEACYGQLTGQSLSGAKKTVSYTMKPNAVKGELVLQIRLGKTNGTDGNVFTVSNVKIEEVAYKTVTVEQTAEVVSVFVHDTYQASIEKSADAAAVNLTATPDNAEAWKVKLFVNTGAKLKAGQKYRIRFDIKAEKETGYEICLNHGGEEKGLGAMYGLTAKPETQVVEYVVYAQRDIDLILQVSLGNCAAPNAVTVSSVHVEEAGNLVPVSETVYTFH